MAGLFNANKIDQKPSEPKNSGGLFNPSKTVTPTQNANGGGLFKPSAANAPTTVDPFDTTKIDNSIKNAEMRIKSAGGEIRADKRNGVEKFLNLPEGQNWLFDTLDVIGRPQQALYSIAQGVIDNDPAPVKRGWEGFTGQNRITGSDFARQAGIKNKVAQIGTGLGIDVVADPINLIPGGAALTGGKALLKGALKGGKAIESLLPALKTARESKVTPVIDAAKDGLGSIFKYQHGWENTLQGTKDDTMKKLFNETENNTRYMTENSLRDVTNAAKSAGGVKKGDEVGRLMEKDLVAYGPRPARQYSTDAQVTQAADDLMKSNNTVRQWALDNDIPVGEIDGYMRHILSTEEQTLRKSTRSGSIDRPRSGMNNPDKKVLNAREMQGSAEDVNDQMGRKMFEPNGFFATAVGQNKLINYGNAVKFRREVLSNPKFAEKHVAGTPIDPSHELINTNNYTFLDNPGNALPNEIGGNYVVTRGTKEALDRYQKLSTDNGVQKLLRAYDTGLSWWKRGTLLSLPYHIRNDLGAKFNSYVAGMNLPDITKYSALATKDVTNALAKGIETPLYNEFRKQGLGSTSQMAVEFARKGDEPDKALASMVKDQSKSLGGKIGDAVNPLKVFNNSQKLGNFVDQMNRFAMYRWAREVKKMTPEEAAAKVKETQFDYSHITKAEKEVLTRMMPFYRWSKNNIPFQLRKFAENPARYTHINKLRTNAMDSFGINDDNSNNFMREQFQIPVTGDGKGNGYTLGLNLPVGDLTKVSSPLKFGVDSMSALLKTPIEYATNNNLFKGGQLQKFDGEQKKYQIPDNVYGVKLPGAGKSLGGIGAKNAYVLEQLGGQPARAISKMLAKPTEKDKEEQSLKPTLGIGSLLKKYNLNQTNFYQKKAELKKLMDMIDYLEQENGSRPKSVNDIKKGR